MLTILRPAEAVTIGSGGASSSVDGQVVGSAPQWGDQSDASYARLRVLPAAPDTAIAIASLPAFSGAAGATAFRIKARASVETLSSDLTLYVTSYYPASWTPVDTGIHEYTFEISQATYPGLDPAVVQSAIDALAAEFAGGYGIAATAGGTSPATWARFYEAWVEFEYPDQIKGRPKNPIRVFAPAHW